MKRLFPGSHDSFNTLIIRSIQKRQVSSFNVSWYICFHFSWFMQQHQVSNFHGSSNISTLQCCNFSGVTAFVFILFHNVLLISVLNLVDNWIFTLYDAIVTISFFWYRFNRFYILLSFVQNTHAHNSDIYSYLP